AFTGRWQWTPEDESESNPERAAGQSPQSRAWALNHMRSRSSLTTSALPSLCFTRSRPSLHNRPQEARSDVPSAEQTGAKSSRGRGGLIALEVQHAYYDLPS